MDVVLSATANAGITDRFEQLYRDHYAELLRYAARRVDLDTAREVVAETFVVAWRRFAEIPADAARAWLYGVARNVLRNELRSEVRRGRLSDRVQALTPPTALRTEDAAEQIVDRDEVLALLARLPASSREVLELIEWDGLELAEAATVLGCSTATLRVRLHRARRRLTTQYLSQRAQATGDGSTDHRWSEQ